MFIIKIVYAKKVNKVCFTVYFFLDITKRKKKSTEKHDII